MQRSGLDKSGPPFWEEGGGTRGAGARPLHPFDATVIAPGLAAVPLTPTPWDDLSDGQHAVTPDGTVWERRSGLWHRHPWWQGDSAEQIVEVCSDPDDWAYDLGWTRKHVEESVGPLTPITLPNAPDAARSQS